MSVTITLDEDNCFLIVDCERFETDDDGESFEVPASKLRSAFLSDLPAGCSIVLCDRVVGSRELYQRSPYCRFERIEHDRFVAHGQTVFCVDDEEDADSAAVADYFDVSIAKGRAALAPLSADGTLLEIEESIYGEIAYLNYAIQIEDQPIPEAESYMAAIEKRVQEGMARPLIFICHASEDKPFVERIVAALDRRALHAWFDKREIFVGDSIVTKINEALERTRYFVPVLSSRSVLKPWVLREINSSLMRQLANEGILILPVRLDECSIPPLLADIKYADFRASFDDGVAEMLLAIRR